MIRVQAPGKMLLIGEYAVLEGCEALVLAVDRQAEVSAQKLSGNEFAVASPSLGILEALPFVFTKSGKLRFDPNLDVRSRYKLAFFKKVFEFFVARNGLPDRPALRLTLQTDAFYSAEWRRKLGFGSSSALTVALYKALDAAWELRLTSEQLFRLALAAHRFVQGNIGSGIDVAASFSGRVIQYKMNTGDAWKQELPKAVPPWPDLPMAVIWSGNSASTKEMVASVSRLKETDLSLYRQLIKRLCMESSGAVQAYVRENITLFLRHTARFRDALRQLGAQSGTPIFTRAHEELVELAETRNCVYKPSGAGGGDIGILFAPDQEKLKTALNAIEERGYKRLAVGMAPAGVRIISE